MSVYWSALFCKDQVSLLKHGNFMKSYELASLSKSITALAAVLLSLEYDFSLDNTISFLLPEISFIYKGIPIKTVTVRMLLCHTAGIDPQTIKFQTESNTSIYETALQIAKYPLKFSPGSHFCYATGCYIIIGALIERLSNMTFNDYCRKRIFEPLKMNNTDSSGEIHEGYTIALLNQYKEIHWSGCTGFTPAAYISSSIHDMKLFLSAFTGNANIPSLLRRAIYICQSKRDYISTGMDNLLYGFGWYLDTKNNLFYHDGCNPGACSYMAYSLDKNFYTIWLLNCNDGSFSKFAAIQTKAIINNSMQLFFWKPSYHMFLRGVLFSELCAMMFLLNVSAIKFWGIIIGFASAFAIIKLLSHGLSFQQIRLWTNDLILVLILITMINIVLVGSVLLL